VTSGQQGQFYGKYRGKVVSNIDPLFLGRRMVSVPAIEAVANTWAMPCVPYAGSSVGFYVMSPIDADVWIEFECGDPNYPIWAGCFWGTPQLPTGPMGPPTPLPRFSGPTTPPWCWMTRHNWTALHWRYRRLL
jgi:hypothetical protein